MKKAAAIIIVIMAVSVVGFLPSFAGADTTIEGKWVKMDGAIRTWNTTSANVVPVFGWIGARAGMVNKNGTYHEWAMVHAIWSEAIGRIDISALPTENFTFSFYAAKLVDSTKININLTDNSFFVSGLWDVLNITTTITVVKSGNTTDIDFTRTVQPLVTNATGEFGVPPNSMNFWLNIDGVGMLRGNVLRIVFGAREIKMFSVYGDDSKVSIKDLVHVSRRYRTTPGLFSYDINSDVNFDGKIDIGDLTTIAANIGR